jgi:hypothetical protein
MQAIVNDVTRTIDTTLDRLRPALERVQPVLNRLHPAIERLRLASERLHLALNRLHPAQLRALVLAVLLVCLGAAPISLGVAGAGHPSSAVAGTAAAGLTETQLDNAATIVQVGEQMGLPKRAAVVAVATSMQETNLRNLANPNVPSSLDRPNDGSGYDHDSVGLFQQRPASGWGSANQLMDPATSAHKFYQALENVPGWENMPVTVAAQTVQGSAFPDAYAQHQNEAESVVAALSR